MDLSLGVPDFNLKFPFVQNSCEASVINVQFFKHRANKFKEFLNRNRAFQMWKSFNQIGDL